MLHCIYKCVLMATVVASYVLFTGCKGNSAPSVTMEDIRRQYSEPIEEPLSEVDTIANIQNEEIVVADKEVSAISNDAIGEELYLPRLTMKRPEQFLFRTGYTTSYNKETKCANWVAWHLTSEHTEGRWSRKGIPYMVDTDVKGPRQELEDWYNNNLPIDHGHMCPAGDNKWSAEAMEQTFLLTNMCPQNSNLNQGDWEELESRCRGWARHYGEVYIACGPIFYSNNYKTIGNNRVGVPDAFFKVVLRMGKRPAALGFIYPNQGGRNDMSHYVMSVDDVEAKTGIDFFFNLPDDIEEKVEAISELDKW